MVTGLKQNGLLIGVATCHSLFQNPYKHWLVIIINKCQVKLLTIFIFKPGIC